MSCFAIVRPLGAFNIHSFFMIMLQICGVDIYINNDKSNKEHETKHQSEHKKEHEKGTKEKP